jgi:aarF domain-containing kinase
MPPSPVYNWLCVLHTTTEILSNIARYKAAQVTPGYVAIQGPKRRRVEPVPPLGGKAEDMKCTVDLPRVIRVERIEENVQTLVPSCAPPVGLGEEATKIPRPSSPDVEELIPIFKAIPSEPTPESSVIQQAMIATASSPLAEPPFTELAAETIASPPPAVPISPYTRNLQSSKVPSSRIGRLFHYGG